MPVSTDWRLRFPSSYNANGYLGLAEIEMRATIGGADETTGRTASAFIFLGGFPPSNAIDNNSATFYTTGGNSPPVGGHWIAVNFASAIQIDQVLVQVRPDGFREDPKDMVVEYLDGTVWTPYWNWYFTTAWTAGESRTADVVSASVPATERLSQSSADLVYSGTPSIRLSQSSAELPYSALPSILLSQSGADIVYNTTPEIVLSQSAVEFVYYINPSVSRRRLMTVIN